MKRVRVCIFDGGLAFVCVDEAQGFKPSDPTMAEVSPHVAYMRFHGRNSDTWEKPGASASERFDYYTGERLMGWLPRIRHLQDEGREAHLLFNTNEEDQGPVNAKALARLLG